MLRIKMLKGNVPIANKDGTVSSPKEGAVIDVSNSVGTSLIRGKDGEQVKHDFDKAAADAKKAEDKAAADVKKAEDAAAAKQKEDDDAAAAEEARRAALSDEERDAEDKAAEDKKSKDKKSK